TTMLEKGVVHQQHRWSPNWAVHKLMRRIGQKDGASPTKAHATGNVFGVSLATVAQRTGVPLPQCMLYVMYYLREQAPTCVGMFRKSGVRSRIDRLREQCELYPNDMHEYTADQAIDVADMLKQYLRELPESILTAKLVDAFI